MKEHRVVGAFALLIISLCAFGASSYTEGAWQLVTPDKNIDASSYSDCLAKWRAEAEPARQRTDYCRQRLVTKRLANVPPPAPIDCVVNDVKAVGDWSACANGVQTRSTTWSRTVVTDAANGGKACPPLPDPSVESRSCSVDPPAPPSDGLVLDTFDTLRQLGGHPLWAHYDATGTGSTKVSASCAMVGSSGLQYDIATGRSYMHFFSNDGGGWRRASSFAPGYVNGKYNALQIWVRHPANIKQSEDYRHSIELGTYIGPGSGSQQGAHFYHFYNLVPAVRSLVILDGKPQHQVGAANGVEQPFQPNYIDNLGRFYWDQYEGTSPAPATICFDEPTFITIPADEDVTNVASIEASYNSATKSLHVGFQRLKQGDVTYTARWSLADFHSTGFAGGSACGVSSANSQGDYVGKKVECTVDLAGKPEVFIAVQRSGNTTFRQIRLPL